MRLRISHHTHYHYAAPTPYGLQQLRLTPRPRPGLGVVHWRIDVDGGKPEAEFTDQHGNLVTLVRMEPDRLDIGVRCEGEVETSDVHGVIGAHSGRAPLWYFTRATQYTAPGPLIRALAGELANGFDNDIARLHALAALILKRVPYQPGETCSATSAEDALKGSRGVCQDHAHIFIAAARLLGFPARYVSGYLVMHDRTAQEAGHAWAEAHVDGLGWVGFDVSNGISPDAHYVGVASGLDAAEAAPIRGVMLERGDERMSVSLEIQQQ